MDSHFFRVSCMKIVHFVFVPREESKSKSKKKEQKTKKIVLAIVCGFKRTGFFQTKIDEKKNLTNTKMMYWCYHP